MIKTIISWAAVSNLEVTVIGQCIGVNDKKMARWYGKKLELFNAYAALKIVSGVKSSVV